MYHEISAENKEMYLKQLFYTYVNKGLEDFERVAHNLRVYGVYKVFLDTETSSVFLVTDRGYNGMNAISTGIGLTYMVLSDLINEFVDKQLRDSRIRLMASIKNNVNSKKIMKMCHM
jgi:hypothetical protein